MLEVGLLRLHQLELLLGLKVGLVVATLAHGVHDVAAVSILIKLFIGSNPPPANSAAFERLQGRFAAGGRPKALSYRPLLQLMLMHDELVALAAQHEVLAFGALPHCFSLL